MLFKKLKNFKKKLQNAWIVNTNNIYLHHEKI